MRKLLGIIIGLAAGIAIIALLESLDGWLFPMDTRLDSDDPAVLAALIGNMPLGAKLLVVFGWFAATFGAAWLALRIGDWRPAAWIVTALAVAATVANLLQLPHPLWMQVMGIIAPLAGCLLAVRLHRAPYPGEPLLG